MERVCLKTPTLSGNIYVGDGAVENRLPALSSGQKNFVVTDSNVYALYAAWFERYFKETEIFVLPAGEKSKNFQSLYEILTKMTEANLHRSSRLFAVGGGVVGDIGGLAAALYMRGISCVQIPTTLLSQVDSSVGGKTAVDLGGVKNIVGAFYQPCEVLVDSDFLKTLPAREIKCGLGEIVKYAALNKKIFKRLSEHKDRLGDLAFLTELTLDCIRHKARVVQADEKESGERRSLNVGHTTGHAIELVYGLSHGECVLHGMRLETKMAIDAGVCEKEYGEELLRIIDGALAVLPTTPTSLSVDEYAGKAKSDKKNIDDGKIRMSVAKAFGKWTDFSLGYDEYRAALKKAIKD
ncbi:MAG: 3-dehydroquinate synthase [Clostridia bacterium]|nr:3-dehydroquinate synthase [Clostridia bacterium]